MDLIFKAGRELGQAVPNVEKKQNGRALSLIGTAQTDMSSVAVTLPNLAVCAEELQELAAISPSGSIRDKFYSTIAFIRDNQLHAFYNKGYQAFCAGHLFGVVEEGLQMHGSHADLAQAKAEITENLGAARDHTLSLESQCGVPGMRQYEGPFNALISNINAARSNGALTGMLQYVRDLANKVGNAIK